VTTITLGRWSPKRLDATYPHTPGAPSTCAYLVLLRVEIARFTPGGPARLGWLCGPGLRRVRAAYAALSPACAGAAQNTFGGSTRPDSSLLL